jgi:hypothetical protein
VKASPYVQGVILFLNIKISAERFANFFYNSLQANLHFAAFGMEDKEFGIRVNLLATSPVVLSMPRWRRCRPHVLRLSVANLASPTAFGAVTQVVKGLAIAVCVSSCGSAAADAD